MHVPSSAAPAALGSVGHVRAESGRGLRALQRAGARPAARAFTRAGGTNRRAEGWMPGASGTRSRAAGWPMRGPRGTRPGRARP